MKLLLSLAAATMLSAGVAAAPMKTMRGQHVRGSEDSLALVDEAHGALPTPKPFPKLYNIQPERCGSGKWRVGCVLDTQTTEQRWYNDVIPKEDRVPMTPEVCFGFCKNSSGAQFFGLKRGDECYCTPFFHNTDKGGHGECDSPCVGDQSQMCGGNEMMDVYQMHDCSNLPALPCKRTPALPENTKSWKSRYYKRTGTICTNAKNKPLTTIENYCEIECDRGYEMTRNDIRCVEKGDRLSYSWAQIEGKVVCSPVNCGFPPEVGHTTVPKAQVVYPNLALYSCQLGFTTDQEPQGPKNFTIKCEWEAKFTNASECLRVKCGDCPHDSKKYNHATAQEEGMRVYEDSCTYDCAEGYTLNAQAAGRKQFGTTCLATGEFSEPMRCMPVECGPALQVPNADVTMPKGMTRNDTVVFPQVLDYACEKGYTHEGKHGSETESTRECQSNGIFSKATACKPNSCGKPPQVDHSTFVDREYFYTESLTYSCDRGYTLSGKAGEKDFEVMPCNWDGSWPKAPVCKPVECGVAPLPKESKLMNRSSHPQMVRFDEPALNYDCDPGYSSDPNDDPWTRVAYQQATFCQANGNFAPMLPCVNINDCKQHDCATPPFGVLNGACVDDKEPTGKPFDDYTCACNAGYEITTWNDTNRPDNEKRCTNINDCPKGCATEGKEMCCGGINAAGIQRGTCQDQLMAYECNCGSGYEMKPAEGSIHAKNPLGNATCVPVICGGSPKNAFSTHDAPAKTDYDTPQWTYTCDEGYSLTGVAGGTPGFTARCMSTGAVSPLEECKPVTCGEIPRDFNADRNPKDQEAFFPMKITYTCDEGYSYNAQFGGKTTHEVECQSDGKLSDMDNCKPVECGLIPVHEHASWTKTVMKEEKLEPAIFVFGDAPTITCDPGYSLDQTTSIIAKSYKLACLSNGEFEPERECKPIKCGAAPAIEFTKSSDASRVFLEYTKYELDEGYTLDGKPDGRKDFTVTCTETGEFSPAETVFPVDCKDAPVMENTTYPGTSHVFPQKAKYSCLNGFATDGIYGGETTYKKQCLPDSTYGGKDECIPVTCLKVEAPNNTKQIDNSKGFKLEELRFDQTAKFECDPGYAIDARVGSKNTKVVAYCRANGTILYPVPCLNINDCESPENQCVSSREGDASFCVDNPEPTGVHFDDFHCACSRGYREDKVSEGVQRRFCFNVNDIPAGPGLTDTPIEWLTNNGDMSGNEFSANETGKTNIWDSWATLPGVFSLSIEVGAQKKVRFGLTTNKDADHNYAGGWQVTFQDGGAVNVKDADGLKLSYGATDVWKMELVGGTGHVALWKNDAVVHTWENGPREEIHLYGKIFIKGKKNEESPVKVVDIYRPGCTPGSSEDLVNDYKCACPDGFHAGHRCQPQTCGKPLEIKFAHTPNDLKVDIIGEVNRSSQEMNYKCDLGYTLDGGADGPRDFFTTCQNNGTITGEPTCLPVRCGKSPPREYAAYPAEDDFVFPQEVDYTCHTGYSYDAKYQKDDKNKKMKTECKSDGTYKDMDTCKAIKCDDYPSQANVAVDLGGTKMKFPEKYVSTCDAGYSLDMNKHQEISYTISCDAEGSLQSTSKVVDGDNCIPIHCGDFPAVPDAGIKGSQRFEGSAVVQCDTGYSTDRTAVKASNNYEIRCQTDGSYSAAPDCLRISSGIPPVVENATASTMEEQFYEDVVTYTLQTGFTLNGKADGVKSFTITAQADGTFTATKTPLPVECGTAPDRKNANHPTKKRVFPNTEPYTCESGYTLDGNANGINSFALSCEPDGKYKGDFACQNVKCNAVPVPPNSERTDKEGDLVYLEKADFQCLPGYTLDGFMAGNLKYKRSCQADGTYSVHPGCVNADDCEGHSCSPNGMCVDNDKPTGVHKDDYHCVCDDGFEEKIEDDGTRTCFNIPDCPEGACLPGLCHDLVNDYKCECPSGYFEGENKFKEIPHDCLGVSCGASPKYEFATTEWTKAKSWPTTGEHRFDLAPLEYECAAGYSLQPELPPMKGNKAQVCDQGYTYYQSDECTGSSPESAMCCLPIAAGPYEFTVACLANATHEAKPDCAAVPGGYPTPVSFASAPEKMFYFPEEIPYECDEGHSTDGTAAGPKSFSGKVEADGSQSGILSCSPIACPTKTEPDTFGANAAYSVASAAALVYEDVLTVTCHTGHALDKAKHDETSYTVTCEADGTLKFSDKRECTPIECVDHKEIGNCEVAGTKFFGEELTATALEGYSLDATTADESKSFEFACQADGSYSQIFDKFVKIVCGYPAVPKYTKITNHKDAYEAFDKIEYELDLGYTEDGTADGKKGYSIECQADGSFTKHMTVQPVKCGKPADKKQSVKSTDEDLTFDQKVVYSCNVGYTLDSQAGGTSSFEESCASDGKFADSQKECKPVDCGAVTTPENSELKDGDAKQVFPQSATYECKPGYSGDRLLSSSLTEVTVSCKADGNFLVLGSCQNNDDCASVENGCESNGKCMDADLPTGKHDDDFHCQCDSGFKEEIHDGVKKCINIDDCPAEACHPGSCVDEVNGYHCECPVGYHEKANPAEKLTADCFPNVCGNPPEVANATTSRKMDDVHYADPTVTYECAEGHSLDQTTNENMYTFSINCKSDKSFEKASPCMPIICAPPALSKAAWDKTEYVYTEVATVSMDSGYFVGGNAAGSKEVKYTCHANSTLEQNPSKAFSKEVHGGEDCGAPAPDFLSVGDKGACSWTATLPGENLGNSPHTIIMEIKDMPPASFLNKRQWIFNIGQSGKGAEHWLWNGGQHVQFGIWSDGIQISKGVQIVGTTQLVTSWDGKNYKVYVDGSLVANQQVGTFNIRSGVMSVGNIGIESPFSGCVKALSVYRSALTEEQIKALRATPGGCTKADNKWEEVTGADSGYSGLPKEWSAVKYYKAPQALSGTNYSIEVSLEMEQDEAPDATPSVQVMFAVPDTPGAIDTSNFTMGAGAAIILASQGYFKEQVVLSNAEYNFTVWTKIFSNGEKTARIEGLNGPLAGGVFTFRRENLKWDKAICPLPRPYDMLGPMATYDRVTAARLRAGDKMTVACQSGHSLDPTDKTQNSYEVECDDEGKIIVPSKLCEPVNCGEAPKVCHANVVGVTTFGGKLEYSAHPGWSLDGTNALVQRSANVFCQADGSFTEEPVFQPINAGPAPEVSHSTMEQIDGEPERACSDDDILKSVNVPMDTKEPKPMLLQSAPLMPFTEWAGPDEEKDLQNPLTEAGIDLGEPCTVTAFRYDTNQSNPAKFELQASSDGKAWLDILKAVTVTDSMQSDDGLIEADFDATNARYWRMKILDKKSKKTTATSTGAPAVFDPLRFWQMKMACGDAPQIFQAQQVTTKTVVKGGESKSRRLNVHRVASAMPVMMRHHSTPAPSALSLVADKAALGSRTGKVVKRVPDVLFKDQVKYTCDEGYFAALSNTAVVYATDPSSFLVEGDSFGELEFKDPTKMAAMSCRPVTCEVTADYKASSLPVIEKGDYAAISYTEKQSFTCVAGYSLDGTPAGPKDFQETCGADGKLTAKNTPKKIDWCLISKCGAVDPSAECENGDLEYKCKCSLGHVSDTLDGSLETCLEVNECDTLNGNEYCMGSTGVAGACNNELANYTCTCESGYENKARDEGGDSCTPVVCPTLPARPKATSAEEGAKLTYLQTATYQCRDGYTLDATPSGTSSFEIECYANASLTEFSECSAVDGGQLQVVKDSTVGTAFAVSLEGMTVASTRGLCIEAVPLPKAEDKVFCNKDWQIKSMGDFDSGDMYYVRPAWNDQKRPNAILWTINSPVNVTLYLSIWRGAAQKEDWMDADGWTTVDMKGITFQSGDGMQGPGIVLKKDFSAGSISINGGKQPNENTFVVFAEPVPSPGASFDPDAGGKAGSVPLPNIYYGQVAVYTCDTGYTTSGTASGPTSFKVTSSTAGTQSDYEACLPISCGVPPVIMNSLGRTEPAVFGDRLTYSCKEGYSINANITGNTTFTVDCDAAGEFVGEKSCMPISCGPPPKVKNSQMQLAPMVYMEQVEVICESGYTVDTDPDGESTFIGKCEADATFTGLKECKAITCGPPPATDISSSDSGEKHLAGEATWKCKDGYSLDGRQNGPTEYTRQCMASGSYGVITPNPAGCVDINACEGNPCSANGICTDSGAGVMDKGGYTCQCNDGFEIKLKDDGSEKCTADDCAGAPCGEGGTCSDLSKVGGAAGSYSCECELGYELDDTDESAPKCKRVVCPPLPSNLYGIKRDDGNNTVISVATWKKGDTNDINVMFNTPILKSYDVATFECAEGYSTDGGVALGTKSFSVSCEPTGLMNRPLFQYAECQKIRCDNWQRPMIPGAVVMNAPENFYEYGDNVEFKCLTGQTTTGYVGDSDSFDVPCQADGLFPDDHPSCQPVECRTMAHTGSTPSHTGNVTYDTVVTYTCLNGYQLAGAGPTTYSGTCGADSVVAVAETRRCEPVICGPIPVKPNALMKVQQSRIGSLALLQLDEAHLDHQGHVSRKAGRSLTPFNSGCGVHGCRNMQNCAGDCDGDGDCAGNGYCFQRDGFTPVPGCTGDSNSDWDYCVAANEGPKEATAIMAAVGGSFVHREDYAELPGAVNSDCAGTSCEGFVEFMVECDQAAQVSFDTEFKTLDDGKSDSFFLKAGTADKVTWHTGKAVEWKTTNSPKLHFAAGTTSMRFLGREDGIKLRKVTIKDGSTFCGFKPPPVLVPLPAGAAANYLSPAIIAECEAGMTVGGVAGGMKTYVFSCQADGTFFDTPMFCEAVKFDVSGSVADAQNPYDKVVGSQIQFLKDGAAVETTTAGGAGIFNVRVPPGAYTMQASFDGYITSSKNVTVLGTLSMLPVLMSKSLAEGEWRFVVAWDGRPSDLDTHVYLGANGAKHLYYGRKSGCDSVSGICANIDVDDVNGWGPETVTITGAKDCNAGSSCLIKYIIHNYNRWSGSMGSSDAIVTLYEGDRMVKKFEIPASVGDARYYRVFTVDTSTNEAYEGDVLAQPGFLDMGLTQSWAAAFNYPRFEKVPSWGVINALSASSLGALHQLGGVEYLAVGQSGSWDCEQVDWQATMTDKAGGWSTCPAGTFLSGLRRVGSRDDDIVNVNQITHGWCCKSSVGSAEHGVCEDISILQTPGVHKCPDVNGKKAGLVGLHKKPEVWEVVPMPKPMTTVGEDFFNLQYRSNGKCIHPNGGSDWPSQDTLLVTYDGCDINRRGLMMRRLALSDGWFRIQHWSGMCVVPNGGADLPDNDRQLVWGHGCPEDRKGIQFREVAIDNEHFMLQHYSGFCVAPENVDNPGNNHQLRLKFCDRTNNRMQFRRVWGRNGGGIVMTGSMVRMRNMYQHAWLDVWGCGCEGNRYCVYTHWDAWRENGQSGRWKMEKKSQGGWAIRHGDIITLQNQYGHKSYLDTRGTGCEGDKYCVSTSDSDNRDSNSGRWEVVRFVGEGHLRDGDWVHFRNQYNNEGVKAWLNTRGHYRRRHMNKGGRPNQEVSATWDVWRDGYSGTWALDVESHAGGPPMMLDIATDGTMVDAIRGTLHKFVVENYYVKLPGPLNTGCRGGVGADPGCEGYIKYYVQCSAATALSFKAEVMAPDVNSDSLYVTVGGTRGEAWHTGQFHYWAPSLESPATNVEAGVHEVKFEGREDAIKVRNFKIIAGADKCVFVQQSQGKRIEVGKITVTSGRSFVPFSMKFGNPKVFIMTSGEGGDDPAKVRISDVSSKGFVAVIDEPKGMDGPHIPMQDITFLAAETGVYELTDGRKIEVGSVVTSKEVVHKDCGNPTKDDWDSVSITAAFDVKPTVFHSLQTSNNMAHTPGLQTDPTWMSSVVKNVKKQKFKVSLDRSIVRDHSPLSGPEEVAWLAIEPGSGSLTGRDGAWIKYAVSTSAAIVNGWGDSSKADVPYGGNVGSNSPLVITSKASRNGGHGGWTRILSKDKNSAKVVIDEPTNCKSERTHGDSEQVAIMAFEKAFSSVIALPELNQGRCCTSKADGNLVPSGLPRAYN